MEFNCINRMLLCFMPSLEAAIFSTIGLAVQLPQEKWPGGMPQQSKTNCGSANISKLYSLFSMQKVQKHWRVVWSGNNSPNSFDFWRSISSHACLEAAIFLTTRGGGKWKRVGVTQSKHGDRDPLAGHLWQKRVYFLIYAGFPVTQWCSVS